MPIVCAPGPTSSGGINNGGGGLFRSAGRARGRARRRLAADDVGVILDRQRPADEIALDLAALLAGEEFELLLGLDAFRHHWQIEPAAERDDGANDGDRLLAVREVGDEGLVDLDLVEGKRL